MARRRTHIEVIQQVGDRLRKANNAQFKEFLDHISYIAVGVSDEDDATKITRSFKVGNLFSYTNHFFNPKTHGGLTKLNAVEYAERIWEREVVPDYRKGKLGRAYWGIGRILHLITDIGIPAHVHLDPHIEGDDYEAYLAHNHNEAFIQKLFQQDVSVDAGSLSIKGCMSKLAEVAYAANRLTKAQFDKIEEKHSRYQGLLGLYYYDKKKDADGEYYYIERPVGELCKEFANELIPLTVLWSTELAIWCIEELNKIS